MISRKLVSGYKLKEITGSAIFAGNRGNGVSKTDVASTPPSNQTSIRFTCWNDSHFILGRRNSTPRKLIYGAKQRELSGTLESELESRLKKQISDLNNKKLSGHNMCIPSKPPSKFLFEMKKIQFLEVKESKKATLLAFTKHVCVHEYVCVLN
uniref:DUF4057 domain-containing protein n=1 Tax=Lactuca sativa TaxID=4236 RepID=A0A9R1UPA1_LACSA|nr:hypothetical protein LSAT_V11C800451000 [Lactuca sativa]